MPSSTPRAFQSAQCILDVTIHDYKVYDKGLYQIKWNLPPHKQRVVHFDRLKPYLDMQEEQGPTADHV